MFFMWGNKGNKKGETIFEEDQYTFMGKDVDFKGNANFKGTVRIDGRFDGHIIAESVLIVGEQAVIKGEIVCGIIICSGKVDGNITASQKIQLLKPAVLVGGVRTPSFSAEEGVVFHGTSDMGISGLDDLPSQSGDVENVHHDLSAHRDHNVRS
jgi:cytoskeletal protein CcmA (bactofilin family)